MLYLYISFMQSGIKFAIQPSRQFLFPQLSQLYQRLIVKSNFASTDTFAYPTDIFPRLPCAQVVG